MGLKNNLGTLQMPVSNFLKMLDVLKTEFKHLATGDNAMLEELKTAKPNYVVTVNVTQDHQLLVINGTVPLILFSGVLTTERYNELMKEFASQIVI